VAERHRQQHQPGDQQQHEHHGKALHQPRLAVEQAAVRTARLDRRMRRPHRPSRAGIRVRAAATATRTTAIPLQASERSNGSANTSNPASETATVRPENANVRPALASLRSIVSGGASPAARSSRNRLASSKRVVDRQPQPGHGHHVDR
jgi:hypothetical protein